MNKITLVSLSFLLLLLSSCYNCNNKSVYYYFNSSYTHWAPDISNSSISFSNTADTNSTTLFRTDITQDFRWITYDYEECIGKVHGEYILANFTSNDGEIKYNVHYYVDADDLNYYDYKQAFDILELKINNFSMRMPIISSFSSHEENYIYDVYANYNYAELLTLNDTEYHDVYFRKNIEENIIIYYTRFDGLIAFKVNDELWIRE